MEKVFDATITYTVDEQHPDYDCMDEKERTGVMSLSDRYTFDCYERFTNPGGHWDIDDEEGMKDYALEDMLLIAGGGYNWDHVHNVKFEFKEFSPEKEFMAVKTDDNPYQELTIIDNVTGEKFYCNWEFEIRDEWGYELAAFKGVDSQEALKQKYYDLYDEMSVDPETGDEYDPMITVVAYPTIDDEYIDIHGKDEVMEERYQWVD